MFKLSFFLAVILGFTLAAVAFAQDEVPPANPQDLANGAVALIAAVAALVSAALVSAIKAVPYLGNEDKDKLATAVTQIVAVGVSVATGYVTALIAQSLGLIDDAGLQSLAIALLTPVLNEARYRVAKLAPVKTQSPSGDTRRL